MYIPGRLDEKLKTQLSEIGEVIKNQEKVNAEYQEAQEKYGAQIKYAKDYVYEAIYKSLYKKIHEFSELCSVLKRIDTERYGFSFESLIDSREPDAIKWLEIPKAILHEENISKTIGVNKFLDTLAGNNIDPIALVYDKDVGLYLEERKTEERKFKTLVILATDLVTRDVLAADRESWDNRIAARVDEFWGEMTERLNKFMESHAKEIEAAVSNQIEPEKADLLAKEKFLLALQKKTQACEDMASKDNKEDDFDLF